VKATEAEPEKRPAGQGENLSPLPDERLAQIKARSTERHDSYDSDTRWLLRYVDVLRQDNVGLRKRRTSFEHKMFTAVILLVGLAVMGVIAYDLYLQPQQEFLPGCTYGTYHSCAAWLWDYYEPLVKHPH
jgi:hypothetical protein